MARMKALVYNWWSLFVHLWSPENNHQPSIVTELGGQGNTPRRKDYIDHHEYPWELQVSVPSSCYNPSNGQAILDWMEATPLSVKELLHNAVTNGESFSRRHPSPGGCGPGMLQSILDFYGVDRRISFQSSCASVTL